MVDFKAIGFGKTDERMYTDLATEHPIVLCRYHVANGYYGTCQDCQFRR